MDERGSEGMPGQDAVAADRTMELQRDVRSAAAIAYGLRRHEQIQQRVWVADALEELEKELLRIEAKLGGPQRDAVGPTAIDPATERLQSIAHDAGPIMAAQIGALVGSVRGLALGIEQLADGEQAQVRRAG